MSGKPIPTAPLSWRQSGGTPNSAPGGVFRAPATRTPETRMRRTLERSERLRLFFAITFATDDVSPEEALRTLLERAAANGNNGVSVGFAVRGGDGLTTLVFRLASPVTMGDMGSWFSGIRLADIKFHPTLAVAVMRAVRRQKAATLLPGRAIAVDGVINPMTRAGRMGRALVDALEAGGAWGVHLQADGTHHVAPLDRAEVDETDPANLRARAGMQRMTFSDGRERHVFLHPDTAVVIGHIVATDMAHVCRVLALMRQAHGLDNVSDEDTVAAVLRAERASGAKDTDIGTLITAVGRIPAIHDLAREKKTGIPTLVAGLYSIYVEPVD